MRREFRHNHGPAPPRTARMEMGRRSGRMDDCRPVRPRRCAEHVDRTSALAGGGYSPSGRTHTINNPERAGRNMEAHRGMDQELVDPFG
jgi:hypothetical protein